MSSAIVQEGRFSDAHESRFQGAKRSNMDSAEVGLLMLRNRIFQATPKPRQSCN